MLRHPRQVKIARPRKPRAARRVVLLPKILRSCAPSGMRISLVTSTVPGARNVEPVKGMATASASPRIKRYSNYDGNRFSQRVAGSVARVYRGGAGRGG